MSLNDAASTLVCKLFNLNNSIIILTTVTPIPLILSIRFKYGAAKSTPQVAALIKLGSLSQIGAKLAPASGKPHNMAKPQDDVVLAYHRDCGETLQGPTRFPSVEEYRQNGKAQLSAEYLYLFDDGKWSVYGLYEISEWVELNVVLGTLGKEIE